MCFHYKPVSKKDATKIRERFGADFTGETPDDDAGIINGFTYPHMPVILDKDMAIVQPSKWGLLPFWVKEPKEFLKKANTLNAMIETAGEKPSFKNYVGNRCLVLSDGFKEWKHEEIGGKLVKTPYFITTPGDGLFAMAGLYSIWDGMPTFTILTAPANELMAEIHNSKKRMPVVLMPQEEKLWLEGERLEPYMVRKEVQLVAQQMAV